MSICLWPRSCTPVCSQTPHAWSVMEPLTSPAGGTQASLFPSSNTSNTRPWHSTSTVPTQTAMFRGSWEGPAEATSRATLSSADSVGSQGVGSPQSAHVGPAVTSGTNCSWGHGAGRRAVLPASRGPARCDRRGCRVGVGPQEGALPTHPS